MNPEGVARLFAVDQLVEGPFPEHYEPVESPLPHNPMHPNNALARHNPAALLALMWFHAESIIGAKAMVVLPYKDRLVLFSKYLQQLVMESLGKELNT